LRIKGKVQKIPEVTVLWSNESAKRVDDKFAKTKIKKVLHVDRTSKVRYQSTLTFEVEVFEICSISLTIAVTVPRYYGTYLIK
jgi:hypothetical protein